MIKKIKSSLSEKILFTFLISLAVFTFGSFYLIKNKCLFVKELDLNELKISDPKNLAIMDVECGKVAIELYPQVSPKSVKRFKYFINSGLYNNSAIYRVIENTLVQAGDLEFGYHDNINYFKIESLSIFFSTNSLLVIRKEKISAISSDGIDFEYSVKNPSVFL